MVSLHDGGKPTGDRERHREGKELTEEYLLRNNCDIAFLLGNGAIEMKEEDIVLDDDGDGDSDDGDSSASTPELPPAPPVPPVPPMPPVTTDSMPDLPVVDDLDELRVVDLREKAQELGIPLQSGMSKKQMVDAIRSAMKG